MGRGSRRTLPAWGAVFFSLLCCLGSSASAGELAIDSRCRGMRSVVACTCALQNGGYLAVFFGQRKAMYPYRFMDAVGKCIREAGGANMIEFTPDAKGTPDCESTHGKFEDNGTGQRTMWVNRNKACEFDYFIVKSDAGKSGIYSTEIVVPPRNGILGKREVRHFTYKPNPEFSGADSFDVEVKYDRDNKVTFTRLHYDVTVR